ncbi:putative gustatory receptor 58c [Drosophila mojavensis]|uniref:Gustatory receptor n=1 Tax=Drosophila mojavensis TaxID=7230 RepID=B4KMX2_DROMO|nr:putative gustatory receptor 58c [Drosophila mojavensis]EDW09894.1 uncharacterized protein Dmoj_GI18812 [Drosophila mojavensis]
MELLSVFVSICRAIGLCNLRYVAERKRFELDQGLMLGYWLLLNVVYVVLTPVCFVLMVNSYYSCQGMDMLSMAYSCVSLTKSCSLFVVLGSVWLRRQRIRRVCNGYMRLLERFTQYHANYSYWRRHLWKLLLSNTRFVVLLNQLFGPGSALMCGVDDDEVVTGLPPIYIGLSVAVLLMDLLASCTDSLAYCVVGTSNRLLECMSQEALELTRDLRWLPPSRGRHRAVYQRQLLAAWHRLWHSCRQLDKLLVELLKIFQALLLLNVFTNYLTEISLFFNLVVLIADAEFISPWRCYFYSVVCLSFHFDILLTFSIFGANQVKWKHLSVRLQQLWLALKAMHVDYRSDTQCVAMLHQLEFAMIYLNRRLQPQPRKVRNLQIMGLFDMNRGFWNSMNASIGMNVLILWQLAYKNYY